MALADFFLTAVKTKVHVQRTIENKCKIAKKTIIITDQASYT